MARATFAARLSAGPSLSETLEQAEPETESPPPVRRALEVGAADDRAELEADAVAAQVLARIGDGGGATPARCDEHGTAHVHRELSGGAGPIGAAGGALDAGASNAIESARGGGSPLADGVRREMESGFGRSLSGVRIHTDARADQLSRQMSARAFTTGRDIFFARGEYDPTSAGGRHTLAHELAHTVQQSGGVQRKLRGTAEALRNQGEINGDKGKSSGFLQKLTGKLTNWDKIVTGVKAYEHKEAKLLAGGKNPDPMSLMSAKPGMLKILQKVQSAIRDWHKANDSETEDTTYDKSRKKTGKRKNKTTGEVINLAWDENTESDTRTKAARRQAVALAEPRIGNEVQLLSSKDGTGWLSSLGLSAGKGKETGRVFGGQMNTVTEVDYQTEGGDFLGFFKEDKGFHGTLTPHENTVGIRQVDPNYGARSVALYRLDQLFDAKVTARAEFAVHTGSDGKQKLGTVLETAKGDNVGDKRLVRRGENTSDEDLSLDDPVLQRGLNKLQLLDAIAGQLDRHGGNYKIQQDKQGNVTGVTGIDLDMAFGRSMDKTDRFAQAFNYRGLPDVIDAEMGRKILQVKASDLKDALTGLLSQAEISATIARFLQVQEAVRAAEKDGRLKDSWGDWAQGGLDFEKSKEGKENRESYKDDLREDWRYKLEDKHIAPIATNVIKEAARRHPSWDVPPQVLDALIAAVDPLYKFMGQSSQYYYSPVVYGTSSIIYTNNLKTEMCEIVLEEVVAVLLDGMDVNKLSVEVQEGRFSAFDKKKEVAEVVKAALPRLTQRFKR